MNWNELQRYLEHASPEEVEKVHNKLIDGALLVKTVDGNTAINIQGHTGRIIRNLAMLCGKVSEVLKKPWNEMAEILTETMKIYSDELADSTMVDLSAIANALGVDNG